MKPKSGNNFALLPKDKLREIASKGGINGHLMRTAHEWTSKEATVVGSKGGKISSENKRKLKEGR